jgi:uncharacterized membrane protein
MARNTGYSILGSLITPAFLLSVMIVLSHLLIATLLGPLLLLGSLPAAGLAQDQGEGELPPGLNLTAELRALIREHREAIREAILEYRLSLETLLERKTELIRGYIEERRGRIEEFRRLLEELEARYRAGNITREEYLSELKSLREEFKITMRTMERLGRLIRELQEERREAVRQLVEELRQINEEFGRRVAEEARRIGERMRQDAARGRGSGDSETNSTQPTEDGGNGNNNSTTIEGDTSAGGRADEARGVGDRMQERGRRNGEQGRAGETETRTTQTSTNTEPPRGDGGDDSPGARGRGQGRDEARRRGER